MVPTDFKVGNIRDICNGEFSFHGTVSHCRKWQESISIHKMTKMQGVPKFLMHRSLIYATGESFQNKISRQFSKYIMVT